jgi:type IV pilus assembly protein PilW
MNNQFVRLSGCSRWSSGRTRQSSGFTLIELMVAMVLGLIVVAGVISVFLANQQAYRTNQALGDVQDGSRMSFELMARDIRNAGLTGCDNSSGRVANVLNNSVVNWWSNWNNAIVGYGAGTATVDPALTSYAGSAESDQVSGSDSLMLLGSEGVGFSVKTNVEPAGTFTLNETTADLQTGDVVIICTPDHAAITQITNYASGGTVTFTHAKSTGNPGNCTTDLSYPTVCSSSSSYVFVPNSQIAKLTASDWYVGHNPVSGTSLYRVSLGFDSGGNPTTTTAEMVRGVTAMSLAYHQSGNTAFGAANSVTNWQQVDAVQVTLTLQSIDTRAGTDGTNVKPLTRIFTSTTTLRNRVN